MKKAQRGAGEPKTIWIEVGPLTCHGSKADILSMERKIKNDLDDMVRQYLSVGKRSKVVVTHLEPERVDGKVTIAMMSKKVDGDVKPKKMTA